MTKKEQLARSLAFMRLTVFVVFLVWTLDKFLRPEHASAVFQNFYFSPGFGPTASYAIGGLQLVIIVAFVLGFQKKYSYGAVFLMHLISTLTSYKQYLAPYEGSNILFFAAWPMLAACAALYHLREHDTMWVYQEK